MWGILHISKHPMNTFFQADTFSFCRMTVPEEVGGQSTGMYEALSKTYIARILLPCILLFVCFVFRPVHRKIAGFLAEEGVWDEFLHSCKQCDFSHKNLVNSQKELDMFSSQCKDVTRGCE